jgi:hypothetical protein
MQRKKLRRDYKPGVFDFLSQLTSDLSDYTWLRVTSDNPEFDGKHGFAVEKDAELSGFLRLRRHFASSFLFTSAVSEAVREGDAFHITLRRGDKLTISACRDGKFSEYKFDCELTDFRLHTLANPDYFCPTRQKRDSGEFFAPVDFGRVGRLSDIQCDKVVRLMEALLGGRGDDRQFCRTVYFSVNLKTGAVRAGLYNLERECPANSILVYTSGGEEHSAERRALAALAAWAMG